MMCLYAVAGGGEDGLNLDALMCRLKDISAYSLSHAEILEQREGVELLVLGMFFGMSSDPRLQRNQERLRHLAAETFDYQGQAEVIEQEVTARKDNKSHPDPEEYDAPSPQMRLL